MLCMCIWPHIAGCLAARAWLVQGLLSQPCCHASCLMRHSRNSKCCDAPFHSITQVRQELRQGRMTPCNELTLLTNPIHCYADVHRCRQGATEAKVIHRGALLLPPSCWSWGLSPLSCVGQGLLPHNCVGRGLSPLSCVDFKGCYLSAIFPGPVHTWISSNPHGLLIAAAAPCSL